ncbi:60S ribosomal protein L6 [Tilletia horrida]|uniref:60S ribosomal protein L6 n=1 Tax=Tilletia horrida TaxID=155126 RepID=A0AAN6GTV4_9BASI|nr:60S ribosomal protein L6 [Tilletia horrida]KAK0556965.1 60S ribosomal protein L6 [Tilletia horrida]KAK0566659.1 60S ribosomal protein L6 [Tilletia horrida]
MSNTNDLPVTNLSRNGKISAHVGRMGRATAYSKKGQYKRKYTPTAAKQAEAAPAHQSKPFGKKGATRNVPTQKASRFYPAEDVRAPKTSRKTAQATKLRSTITPGTVLILLAGRFAGKRVVFLKQLASGLLLVTGPFKVNGVPVRRVNQAYVIATSTKLDLAGAQVDSKFDDAYFKREKAAKVKAEASFFADPANKAPHPESKVSDQKSLDKEIIAAAKKAGPLTLKYLASTFSLSNGDRPHELKF